MMTAEKFVENVRAYIGRPYSEIDCAMLLHLASDGAIRRGSNSQWRYEIGEHGRISDGRPTDPYPAGNDRKSSQLDIGMAVFMHKAQDTDKYPDGQGDYSHVGVVTSVQPLRITNASSVDGCVTDYTKIGTFCAWGYLKAIDYGHKKEQGDDGMYRVQVTASSLHIRAEGNTKSAILGSLPRGSVVTCANLVGGWYKLANSEGWICGDYVIQSKQEDNLPEAPSAEGEQPEKSEPVPDWAQMIASVNARVDTLTATVDGQKAVIEQLYTQLLEIREALENLKEDC